MIPILIGAAAAVLLVGCTSSNNENSNTDSSPPAPPPSEGGAEDRKEPDSPPPPPPLTLEFNEKSKASPLYLQLKEAQVSDADLDQGLPTTDYSKTGTNPEFFGKGDGKLNEREIYEYTFNHSELYQKTIEGLMGKALPWTLDDQDPATDFDDKIRQKLSEATLEISTALKAQGLEENSPEYQEKLALALFYFVDFPSDPKKSGKNEKSLRARTKELDEIGLKSFQDRLIQLGGLGVSEIKTDAPQEGSALSALKSKRGGITEKAKILYAVFKNAGLEAFFARTRPSEIEIAFKEKGFRIPWENRQDFHTCIGLRLGDKTRLFDLTYFQSRAEYSNYYPLTLSQVAAGEMNQLGFEYFLGGKPDKALEAFQGALYLDPNYPITYNNLGNLFAGMKKMDIAEKNLEEAVKLDPGFGLAYMNLGNIAFYEGKLEKALTLFEKARKLDPKYPMVYNNLAAAYLQKKKYDTAIKLAKEALRLDPKNSMFKHNLELAEAAKESSQ